MSQGCKQNMRRANALILVVGILVLLVLVATAFITKTQSGRVTSVAQRDAAQINDRNQSTMKSVADEIGDALFPRLVVTTFGVSNGSANARRDDPNLNTPRFGHDPTYPFNYAPFEVVPWTNPPDDTFNGIPLLGPENPLGGPSYGDARWLRDLEPMRSDFVDFVGQGLSDWSGFEVDGTPETFTHWRHLSNLSRSGNSTRVVRNISDVVGNGLVTDLDVPIEQWPIWTPLKRNGNINIGPTGYPTMDLMDVGDLNSGNWEAWGEANGQELISRFYGWQSLQGWAAAQLDPALVPPNFLDLSDLDADGIHNEAGERPVDAFVRGSPRWYVESMLTDTDGDGFTDAFWNLHPQQLGPDVRQVFAVSVTDNSGRGNMNVATRFHRKDYYGTDNAQNQHGQGTRGHTPADLAIVGQNDRSFQNITPWRVGFMDNLANLPGNTNYSGNPWVQYSQIGTVDVDWNTNQWRNRANASLLDELGIEVNETNVNSAVFEDPTNGALSPSGDITSRYGRLWYWQIAGRDPFSATLGLRPFTLSDELELRLAEGNNYQFVGSRFERSVNDVVGGTPTQQFLRSDYQNRHEASELRDQLDNRQLLFDNRRKLTMFNGTRNDLLAPWLRWEDRFWNRHDPQGLGLPTGYDTFDLRAYEAVGIPDQIRPAVFGSAFPTKVTVEAINAAINGGTQALEQVVENWRTQSRQKIDLREYYADSSFGAPWWEKNDDGKLTLAERAPLQVLLALTDSQEVGTSNLDLNAIDAKTLTGDFNTVTPDVAFGDFDDNYYQQSRVAAAGFTSNLLSYRDNDNGWRLHSMLPETINGTIPRIQIPLSAAVEPPIIGRQDNDSESPIWGTFVPYDDAPVSGPNESHVRMLGMEAQPFILETMIAHAHQGKVPGDHGACCLDTGGCQDVSEETCLGLLGGTFFSGELCDPDGDGNIDDGPCPNQGACCVNLGGCIYTSETSCDTLGGTYLGNLVPCAETTCSGTCCLINGECEDLSASSCESLDGIFAGFGTDCVSVSCTVSGSCCFGSGSCMEVLTDAYCVSQGGTFVAGVSCFEDPCFGPCCVEYADCINVSEEACADVGGGFFGLGSVCTNLTCVSAGACCVGSDSCTEVLSVEECNSLDGIFVAAEACISNPCNGSCCLGEGVCQDVSLGTCFDLAGDFVQGISCDVSPCRSACCFSTGGCENLLQATCEAFNGIYMGGATFCDEDPCLPVGACCLPDSPDNEEDGGCMEIMQEGCELLGGTFQGSGVVCGSVPCGATGIRGACCLETGQCQNVVSESICDSLGGIYQGPLVSCIEDPCLPASACCLENGTCINLIEENCISLGGTFNDTLSCAEDACSGGCCLPDGSCVDVMLPDCNLAGGTFFSERMCATSPCSQTGACCISGDVCDDVSQDQCENSLGGVFQGPGTTCQTDPCSFGGEGACCLEPFGCVLVVEQSCIQSNGIWDGTSACDETACSLGACCLENGTEANCVEVVNSNSCDLLGGSYKDGEDCSTGPCEGACCLFGGGCEVMSRESCLTLDGQPGKFNGLGTRCGPIACDVDGSCCLPSDSCIDIIDEREFTDYCEVVLGGTWRPGEYCADVECGGACCLATGGCEDLPEVTCDSIGGIYQGSGVFCASEPCGNEGACCFDSGSCLMVPEAACTLLNGEYQGIGIECDPDSIPGSGDEPCPQYFLLTEDTDDCPQETIAVVQIANPYDRAINLNDYAIEFFGQEFQIEGLDLVLPPATMKNPSTAIFYAISNSPDIEDPSSLRDFQTDWLDFLDLEADHHPVDDLSTPMDFNTLTGFEATIIHQVPNNWRTKRAYYDNLTRGEQNSVALYRFDRDTTGIFGDQRVLIDRIDRPDEFDTFEERVVDDLEEEWDKICDNGYLTITDKDGERILADSAQAAMLVQWDRATRAWGVDIPVVNGWHDGIISTWEDSPRYVSAAKDFIRSEELRTVTNVEHSPPNPDIKYTSAFHWTDFTDPDDRDGDGNPDTGADPDLLPDDPDPWFTVEVWSPRGGDQIIGSSVEGEVKGGLRIRKPFYFDMNMEEDLSYMAGGERTFPDKGWYGQRNDEDGDDTTSDTASFADDVIVNEVISLDERNIPMDFPMQMLQKDDDYEQVGELLNVWLFGHMLEGTYNFGDDDQFFDLPESHLDSVGDTSESARTSGTITTFSEFLDPRWGSYGGANEDWFAPWVATIDGGEVVLDPRLNRLRFTPDGDEDIPQMLGGRSEYDDAAGTFNVVNHAWPKLSAASRILDSFVCDGPGRPDFIDASTGNYGNDGIGDDLNPNVSNEYSPTWHSFYNANGYSGKATPGLININTASVEVMRMLPHMYKVVHETEVSDVSSLDSSDRNPRSLIPESIYQWRETANGGPDWYTGNGYTGGPNYSDRSAAIGVDYGNGPNNIRGFSSPAEIGLLQNIGAVDDIVEPWHIAASGRHQAVRDAEAWSINFAAADPFGDPVTNTSVDWIADGVGAKISTDVNRNNYYNGTAFSEDTVYGDGISGDAEELNMLQAGISNLISTRGDIFTVHMRIRTFRRNSITGIWDATNEEQIIDDSRYVLLVDRSHIETPADQPKILYYEKLPN